MGVRTVPLLAVLLPWSLSVMAMAGDVCKTAFGSVTPCEIEAFAGSASVANAKITVRLNNTSAVNWSGLAYPSGSQACAAIANDDWLSFSPMIFDAPAGIQSQRLITASLNATLLADGVYDAYACVRVEMGSGGMVAFPIPVRFVVGDGIFADGFE